MDVRRGDCVDFRPALQSRQSPHIAAHIPHGSYPTSQQLPQAPEGERLAILSLGIGGMVDVGIDQSRDQVLAAHVDVYPIGHRTPGRLPGRGREDGLDTAGLDDDRLPPDHPQLLDIDHIHIVQDQLRRHHRCADKQ